MLTNFKTVIKEKNRMCNSFEDCEYCFLCKSMELFNYKTCEEFMSNDPERFASEVTKWVEKNPRKTNENIFSSKFKLRPWSEKNEEGYIRCGYRNDCNEEIPCNDCPWWREPINAEWDERFYEEPVKEEIETSVAKEETNEEYVEKEEVNYNVNKVIYEDNNLTHNNGSKENDIVRYNENNLRERETKLEERWGE